MTTSLPSASPESLSGATPAACHATALLGAFAGAFTPLLAADGTTVAPPSADFAALLGAADTPALPPSLAAPSAAPATVPLPVSPGRPVVLPQVVLSADTPTGEVPAETAAIAPAEAVPAAEQAAAIAAPAPAEDARTAAELPDRATLEAALAMVAPLLVSVTPTEEAAIPPVENTPEAPVRELAEQEDSDGGFEGDAAPRTARVTLSLPGRTPIEVDVPVTDDPLPVSTIATALLAKASPTVRHGFDVPLPASAGAISSRPAPTTHETSARVEIALASGAKLGAEFAPSIASANAAAQIPERPVMPVVARQPEKNAARAEELPPEIAAPKTIARKNFLSAAEQSVTPSRAEAGIAVAQSSTAMPAATFAPIATAHAAEPVAALVERMPAAERPELTHVAQSVAQRAVDTVTSVVDAQAASRLQPAPMVQLRFKVGSEDLTVRVELRDGEVRTEFRTDSGDLRSALTQEWRAVTARPDAAIRFLEPLIAPANVPGQGGSSFSSSGQHSSQQQQHAQQQFRAQAELFGSVGRSFAPAAAEAAPAVVTPLVLPTSQRLSAVA